MSRRPKTSEVKVSPTERNPKLSGRKQGAAPANGATGSVDDEVIFLQARSLDNDDDNVITYGPPVRQGLVLPEPSKVGEEDDADGGGGVDEDDLARS